MAADAEKTLRLFFALWPDADTRTALDRTGKWLHRHWEGRRTRPETLHLTLVFLGTVDASRLDELRELAAQVRAEKFALNLDQAGCWRHNRVGWLGAGETPPALAILLADLESRLVSSLFRFDKRAFVPHITLLRKARCAEAPACRPGGLAGRPLRPGGIAINRFRGAVPDRRRMAVGHSRRRSACVAL
jgi:RNA 2',3'-cyclic 3'-phosphodiesterase